MPEYVECNLCHAKYDDPDSVRLIKDWMNNPELNKQAVGTPAPCPMIACRGTMELKEE